MTRIPIAKKKIIRKDNSAISVVDVGNVDPINPNLFIITINTVKVCTSDWIFIIPIWIYTLFY